MGQENSGARRYQSCGGPAGVLAAACETRLAELIPLSNQNSDDCTPLTVRRIVHDLFADELPIAELDAFAERLHLHLMPPGDLLMITLFFVEHILPHLGEGQGWLARMPRITSARALSRTSSTKIRRK